MNHAYVSLICSGDAYLQGLETLGRSLVQTGSTVPRVLLATDDVSPAALAHLRDQGWRVQRVEPIPKPHTNDQPTFVRFDHSYTKLRAFGLEGFDKLVFLDADTLVLRNVDALFDRPGIAAAPDFFMPDRFNSGVMVIEPNPATLQSMLTRLAELSSYDGGDQGFLNAYWPDWWSMPAAHRLGAGFNMHHFVFQFMLAHPGLRAQFIDEIKIVHYTLQKPWKSFTVTGGSEVWWNAFYGLHPERDHAWRRRLHALQDWTFDNVVSLLGGA